MDLNDKHFIALSSTKPGDLLNTLSPSLRLIGDLYNNTSQWSRALTSFVFPQQLSRINLYYTSMDWECVCVLARAVIPRISLYTFMVIPLLTNKHICILHDPEVKGLSSGQCGKLFRILLRIPKWLLQTTLTYRVCAFQPEARLKRQWFMCMPSEIIVKL